MEGILKSHTKRQIERKRTNPSKNKKGSGIKVFNYSNRYRWRNNSPSKYEGTLAIADEEAVGASGPIVPRVQVVHERDRPLECTDDKHLTLGRTAHPVGKLHSVRNCGTQHDDAHCLRQQNHHLLPHVASLKTDNSLEIWEKTVFSRTKTFCWFMVNYSTVQIYPEGWV